MPARALQALFLRARAPIAATLGDPHSSGLRTERSTADAREPGFKVLARTPVPPWILEGAIRACCDGLSHTWFVAHIPLAKARRHKWRKVGFVDQHRLYPTAAGVPQGGICTPLTKVRTRW
jgi:RNA-directed DNA polymerase